MKSIFFIGVAKILMDKFWLPSYFHGQTASSDYMNTLLKLKLTTYPADPVVLLHGRNTWYILIYIVMLYIM